MRERCPRCEFILERCLCASLRSINNSTTLIVLQHPSEKHHALNTVQIMKKSFERFHLFIGETFENCSDFISLIEGQKVALLFPDTQEHLHHSLAAKTFTHLILLDGTWRKAKKIYYSNPILHALPKMAFSPEEKSHYRIRQSSLEHGLSTLEAAVLALKILEPQLDCQSVLHTFERMIDFQIEKMSKDVYEKNYLKKTKGDE